MSLDTHLLAHIQDGTGGAVRKVAGADMLAEGDEQPVDLDPIAARQFGFKGQQRFFRGRSLYITPTIGHTMNMNIHADEWLSTGNTQNQMCTLWADPGERAQDLSITG